jgi:5-formyltetrahydrofolate cyclo-ligase
MLYINDMNSIKEQKKELRKLIKTRKALYSNEERIDQSKKVFSEIESLPSFANAKTVLAYWSLPDEVQTHSFIEKWYKHKTIVLPLVVGDTLELKVYTGPECMEEGPSYGILEPKNGVAYTSNNIDLGIIPGMAFDLQGNRLGRGKGYYDKLLKEMNMKTIGVCFSFQLVDKVPSDTFDIAMDSVICPQ